MEATVQHADVPRPPAKPPESEETIAVGFRLPKSLVKDLDAEAKVMAPPGLTFSRTDALRVLVTEAIAARRASRTKRK